MNELKMFDILEWWCLKSTSPYKTEEEKQSYQDKLDKVMKLIEKIA